MKYVTIIIYLLLWYIFTFLLVISFVGIVVLVLLEDDYYDIPNKLLNMLKNETV